MLTVGAALVATLTVVDLSATTPWEAYVAMPTPQNARRVQAIAYTQGVEKTDLATVEADLGVLESQLLASDREAVRLGFRALAASDGHYAELLSQMIGRLIRVNTALFLRELKANRTSVARLDSLVGALGDAFVDREEARRYELSARASALRRVTDPSLRTVRDECLAALAE